MKPVVLWKNIWISYKTYFRLLWLTFFKSRHTQGRLTLRRFVIMTIFCPALLILKTMHWLGFIFDEIFFRGYKTIAIQQPLFVVGVPRSGTTFLHRLLAEDKERFTTFTLWELIFAPSITERKIVLGLARLDGLAGQPLKRLLQWVERKSFGGLENIHLISLSDAEEDYFLLAPIYACFLLILPFPFPEELGYLAFFDDHASPRDKTRIMNFYKSCLQRHLYVWGNDKILLSKNVSFGPLVLTLSHVFPDSRLIGTVRDPIQAVPSHISAMMEGAILFDNDIQGHTFRNHMIAVQRYAYTHLAEVLPRLPEDRQMTVRMEDLQTNLHKTVINIYERFGYKLTPAFDQFLRRRDRAQKTYQSAHAYHLDDFSLTAQDLFDRFSDVYRRYGYPLPSENHSEERPAIAEG